VVWSVLAIWKAVRLRERERKKLIRPSRGFVELQSGNLSHCENESDRKDTRHGNSKTETDLAPAPPRTISG
jgi:hypothetical protein